VAKGDEMSIRIGIVGDFDSGFQPHVATNAAIAHVASSGLAIEYQWLPTPSLESPFALEGFHGLWIALGACPRIGNLKN
jgi:hypothetical protein